jgi:hypothetical protein
MLTTETLQAQIDTLLQALVRRLGGDPVGQDSSALLGRYKVLKAELGNSQVAGKLGLNQNSVEDFNKALRDLERSIGDAQMDQRNRLIVQLRFISWMETISQSNGDIPFDAEISALISEELGRKQVRALELIIRSLVSERFGDQASLEQGLADLLNSAVVAKWKKSADPDDLLSGTTFSELASLFVNSSEYPNYSPLFADSPFLTYLRDKRKTIQNFLEDIRRVRNTLAHNKRVSNTQLSLLDLYYEELISPVQEAHDQGQTRVNPDNYLDVSREELDDYFTGLHEDIASVKDDIAEFRSAMQASLGGIASDTRAIGRRQQIIGLGVALAVAGIALVIWLATGTREETREIRQSATRIEEQTGKSLQASQAATEAIVDSTRQLNASVENIREGFTTLSKLGGLIDDPQRPEQFYHNARIYELNGDLLNARKSYESLLGFALDVIDPHLRHINILKAQEGMQGAARSYRAERPGAAGNGYTAAASQLLEGQAQLEALQAVLDADPEYAPAVYLLSLQHSQKALGQQSLHNKREEKKALESFLQLAEEGRFLKHFIDKEMANEWLEDARVRLKALAMVEAEPTKAPFVYTATRSNSGWGLYFNIPEVVRRFFYKLETDADYTDNGLADYIDQRLGAPTAKTYVQLPPKQQDTRLLIKYIDIQNRENGPYAINFSVADELVKSQIKTLNMTKNSWLSFRRDPAYPLLYFTHLQSYRCAIAEVHYGLDKEQPDTLWTGLGTQCDLDDPIRMQDGLQTHIKVSPGVQFVSVQLTYKDGSQSDIVKIER